MILVRNVFQLKFGFAKPIKELMKESKKLMPEERINSSRILFDLVGPAYTMVLETTYDNLSHFETELNSTLNQAEWGAWYQKVIPHVNSSYREIFTIQEF